ncbi:branched-chain amino acid aminotransferase II [Laetiporus sulphureus 93-53]|uniref:Branched-chain-amino-acid aminotransferase n=1 Tax=Laetiporus sulphureus 93-53 TaxID=1314785 RepID=A0A165GPQ9_9APHY|nr:branched-chain amino acid aminotransferase II [Laetiporus sulphureus 93-53]KZT10638.1 branched-chain amino acid aminotransferase II [Laetiporus sulphureus 93-53]
MLTIPWSALTGWGTPQIYPYQELSINPAATVLHFAHCLFEAFKAYRDPSGRVLLFRPDMNMKRMNSSAARLTMPTFDGEALLELIKRLVHLEKDWIPTEPGYSLYVRPSMIGTEPTLVVKPPNEVLLMVICSPVGPYYPQGFKPVSLYATAEYVRASPGGVGAYKLGANYAQSLYAQKEAEKLGYAQVLWLRGPEHYITEVGTMNAFAAFKHPDGAVELATPPLDSGLILPGVTRDSVLTLARDHASGKAKIENLPDQLVVAERHILMKEVAEAVKAGTLVEFFGTGTASVVTPVERINYLGEDITLPVGSDGMGPVSRPLWHQLIGIQTGKTSHPWSIVV